MHVTTGEGFETLTVSELHIERAAVRIDEGESIELARVARIMECAEVAPIDFEALPGERLHAYEGSPGSELWPDFAYIFLQDAVPTAVSERAKPLLDYGGSDFGIFLQPLANIALEGIEFTETLPFYGTLRGRIEILADRLPAHLQMALDFADGPVLGPVEPVQVIDLIGCQHRLASFMRQAQR